MPIDAKGPALLVAAAFFFLTITPLHAQTGAKPGVAPARSSAAAADPADANAPSMPVHYRSAFEGYRPNTEAAVEPWREANDRVGRIGGWRAYAREASQPDAAASAPTGHGHHHAPRPQQQPQQPQHLHHSQPAK